MLSTPLWTDGDRAGRPVDRAVGGVWTQNCWSEALAVSLAGRLDITHRSRRTEAPDQGNLDRDHGDRGIGPTGERRSVGGVTPRPRVTTPGAAPTPTPHPERDRPRRARAPGGPGSVPSRTVIGGVSGPGLPGARTARGHSEAPRTLTPRGLRCCRIRDVRRWRANTAWSRAPGVGTRSSPLRSGVRSGPGGAASGRV